MMRLQWIQDLDIETLEARGHWAIMEEMLEVVTDHLTRYENIVKTCKTTPGQVNPSYLSLAALREHCENEQNESWPSSSFRPDICYEICSQLSLHEGKGVPPYDVSVFDRGRGQCRKGKRGNH